MPFNFVEKYLTGVEPKDMGKLLGETFLWFAMASSGAVIGAPHVDLKVPIEFNEIDLLLYDSAGDFTSVKECPADGWESHLKEHAVCLMEFTIGHHADIAKQDVGDGSGNMVYQLEKMFRRIK